MKLTREHLIKDYFEFKEELGRAPTSREYVKRHHSNTTLQKMFRKSGWSTLLHFAGERPKRASFVTRATLIRDYRALKKKLGKQPSAREYRTAYYGKWIIRRVFGKPGWRRLVEAAGDTLMRKRTLPVTAAMLIRYYRALKKKLGRRPGCIEYQKAYYGQWIIERIFGRPGWRRLVQAAGDTPFIKTDLTATMLIRDYRALKKKLGRRPRCIEYQKAYRSLWIIERIFGTPGWTNLVHAAGDKPLVALKKPFARYGLTAGHLIADFLDLQEKLGRRPTIGEYLHNCHTPKVLDRVFGRPGWWGLIRAVGKRAMPKSKLTAEHLIQDYLDTEKALGPRPGYTDFRKRHHHTRKILDRVFGKPGWLGLRKTASPHLRSSRNTGRIFLKKQKIQIIRKSTT